MKKKRVWLIVVILVVIGAIIAGILMIPRNKEENTRKYKVQHTRLTPLKKRASVVIRRYEKDLFSINQEDLPGEVRKLSAQYPDNLIQEGIWNDPQMMNQLKGYLNDPVIRDIYNEVMKVFPDLNRLQSELEDALAHYLYYFPEEKIPSFYTLVPGIDFYMPSVYAIGNDLFIHLDMYLGTGHKFYDQYAIPRYISERFDPEFIGIDCFKKALVYRHLTEETRITLLDHMIYEGKKLYFTELMFPQKEERLIIGYNKEKYDWAEKHHGDVWNYMIGKDQLFSKNDKEVTAYINESPFTKPFSNESPGRIGTFIGWKIVRNFMEHNPEVSLEELMNMTDTQYILNKSRYKPSRR